MDGSVYHTSRGGKCRRSDGEWREGWLEGEGGSGGEQSRAEQRVMQRRACSERASGRRCSREGARRARPHQLKRPATGSGSHPFLHPSVHPSTPPFVVRRPLLVDSLCGRAFNACQPDPSSSSAQSDASVPAPPANSMSPRTQNKYQVGLLLFRSNSWNLKNQFITSHECREINNEVNWFFKVWENKLSWKIVSDMIWDAWKLWVRWRSAEEDPGAIFGENRRLVYCEPVPLEK
jgi:hypothetical protein